MNLIQKTAQKIFRLSLPYYAATGDIDESDKGWTPISVSTTDIPDVDIDRMFQIASVLYKRNPIAKRVIDTQKAFVVGRGIYVSSEDKDVNTVVQRFWKDRRNNWRRYLKERVHSLALYGEALWPAYVNTINGSVHLGSNHPGIIHSVLPNVRNHFEPEVLIIKEGRRINKIPDNLPMDFNLHSVSEGVIPQQALSVIHIDTNVDSPTKGYYVGDTFFYAINKPMDNLRGSSDLLSIADWIDIFDKFLFNRASRQEYINSWLWDIKLEGYDENQIREWMANQILLEKQQKAGKMFAHNEKVERKAISPQLNSDDAVNDASMFMKMILGGSGFPSHAFGDPGNTGGREISGDMNEYTFHNLQDRQDTIYIILQELFDFVIDQAIIHKELDKSKRGIPVHIYMPKISLRDMQRITQALRNFGTFLNNLEKGIGTGQLFKLDDVDKNKLKNKMNFLLEHIDLNAEAETYVDLETKNEIDATLIMETIKEFQENKELIYAE